MLSGENWLAFVPTYARYPYQVHMLPRDHFSSVSGVDDEVATEELASMLLRVIRAYNRVFEAPMPYMLALHQLADPRYHFHIELLAVGRAPGKLKLAASSEAAWGFWLNDSLPEIKAAELRAAIAEDAHDERIASPICRHPRVWRWRSIGNGSARRGRRDHSPSPGDRDASI